jgi:hypothetical protein
MIDDILATAQKILEAAEKATPTSPFEWEYFITGDEGQDLKIATKFDAYHSSHEIAIILGFDETTVEEEEANAAYIVAAANAAPQLAAEVIRLRERIVDLEDQTGVADNIIQEMETNDNPTV